jgi:hypothetical protein
VRRVLPLRRFNLKLGDPDSIVAQAASLPTGVAAAGWKRGARSGIGRARGLSIRGASARGGAPGRLPVLSGWPVTTGLSFCSGPPGRAAPARAPAPVPAPGRRWPRPRLRPDTRVGSDAKDPHRSRGSPQQRPYAVPTLSTGNAPCAASAEPPVLPPLRNPAAFLKAAPTSWCGPASAAVVEDLAVQWRAAVGESCSAAHKVWC